jgi:hypothetical protein
MEAAELELQSGITRAFILADAEDIQFTRRTKVADGAGGFIHTEVDIATQTGRMIPQTDQVPELTDSNGRMAAPQWVLLMEANADMHRYDRFIWRGMLWEIAQVHTKPDYQTKGDVILVGS